jgi:hypothetical protein
MSAHSRRTRVTAAFALLGRGTLIQERRLQLVLGNPDILPAANIIAPPGVPQ